MPYDRQHFCQTHRPVLKLFALPFSSLTSRCQAYRCGKNSQYQRWSTRVFGFRHLQAVSIFGRNNLPETLSGSLWGSCSIEDPGRGNRILVGFFPMGGNTRSMLWTCLLHSTSLHLSYFHPNSDLCFLWFK